MKPSFMLLFLLLTGCGEDLDTVEPEVVVREIVVKECLIIDNTTKICQASFVEENSNKKIKVCYHTTEDANTTIACELYKKVKKKGQS